GDMGGGLDAGREIGGREPGSRGTRHDGRRTGRRRSFVHRVKNGPVTMGDRFYADDGSGGTVTAVIPREFAKGPLIAQIFEQDLTLDDYFGGGGNLQRNRQATNELDWLAAQCARNRQLIPTVGNRRDGRHRHYRIGAEHDDHRKRLVGPLAPLVPQMAIGFDQNAQRVSIMNLIAVDTDVTNLAVGILADMATQGQIGSTVERVPDRYREFSQVHLIAP